MDGPQHSSLGGTHRYTKIYIVELFLLTLLTHCKTFGAFFTVLLSVRIPLLISGS